MSTRKVLRDIVDALIGSSDFALHPSALTSTAYPLDLDFTLVKEPIYYTPKDAAGLPVRLYKSVGVQYNPTRIAAYGLAHYNRYITAGGKHHRDTFLRVSDWFMTKTDGLWWYDFDWGELRAPWLSCMAQGEGISVLVRAYFLTGDDTYLAQAVRAARPLATPIEEGGVKSFIDGKHPFLEEYPLDKPRHTLNGFLYALVGLLDLTAVDARYAVSTHLDAFVSTLETQWYRWDLDGWSAYDLHGADGGLRNPATVGYHRLHVTLTSYIAEKRSSESLRECARRWHAGYRSRRLRLGAALGKIRYRMRYKPQR